MLAGIAKMNATTGQHVKMISPAKIVNRQIAPGRFYCQPNNFTFPAVAL
jgi:hypothetical protein